MHQAPTSVWMDRHSHQSPAEFTHKDKDDVAAFEKQKALSDVVEVAGKHQYTVFRGAVTVLFPPCKWVRVAFDRSLREAIVPFPLMLVAEDSAVDVVQWTQFNFQIFMLVVPLWSTSLTLCFCLVMAQSVSTLPVVNGSEVRRLS